MRKDIHPALNTLSARCACGAEFEIQTTKGDIRLDICSKCHPFFTGKQKIVDTAGRVERFKKRYASISFGSNKKAKK